VPRRRVESHRYTADGPKVKHALGDACGGGFTSGPVAENMNVAKGIETGFSLQMMNGLSTIAAMSTGFTRVLELHELTMAAGVTIGADNDPAGQQAAIAAAYLWRDEDGR